MSEIDAYVGPVIKGDVNLDVFDTIQPLWNNKDKLTQRETQLVYALAVLAKNQLTLKERVDKLEAKAPVTSMAGGAKKRSKKTTTAKKSSKKASKKGSKKGSKTAKK